MNLGKTLQTLAAVAALVETAKQANKDGRVTPAEWSAILSNGVLPLLAIHGVKIDVEPGLTAATNARERVSAAIALMDVLDSLGDPPKLPDRQV